jgi:Dolichyl-phosphate-mannose-protein mannosyltransferase
MKRILLFLIILLGLSLRVTGADWGFPFLLHPDEPVVANMPVDMAERASLDPGEYNHPDHFDIYANALLYHAASHLVLHKPLTETFAEHTLTFYRLSRILVAILGTACIFVAFLIGREYDRNTGLFAALLVAIFPSYVNHSHYITSDIPLTLFILSVILFVIRYLKGPTQGNLLAASLFAALSLSVKYPGGLTLLLIIAAIICKHHREKKLLLARVSQGVAAFTLALFLVSPYLFINYDRVIQAIAANAYPVHLGADALSWPGNMLFYAKSYLDFSGILMLCFFFMGSFYIIRKEKLHALPVFFGLLYWIILSKIGLHWERWALPMYTAPLLVSAYGFNAARDGALRRGGRYLFPLWCAVLILIVGRLLVASAVTTANFTLRDTRFASFLFTRETGIREENTLYEGYTPFYPHSLRDGSVRIAFNIHDKHKKIRFVIVSSGVYDRYLDEKERYAADVEFYDKVFALPLIRKFAQKEYFADGKYPFYLDNDLARGMAFLADYTRNREQLLTGPTIQIYRYDSPGFLDR